MTLALAFSNNEYSLLMVDERETIRDFLFGIDEFKDGKNKLVNLDNCGWAVSSGFSNLSQAFFNELKTLLNLKSLTSNEIEHVYLDELRKVKLNHSSIPEEVIDKTVCIFSTVSNKPRINIISKELHDGKLANWSSNYFLVVYPEDYLNDTSKSNRIEKIVEQEVYEEIATLNDVLYQMAMIFKIIAMDSPFCSEEYRLGIHFKNNTLKNLKGNVDELIEYGKNNRINELINHNEN